MMQGTSAFVGGGGTVLRRVADRTAKVCQPRRTVQLGTKSASIIGVGMLFEIHVKPTRALHTHAHNRTQAPSPQRKLKSQRAPALFASSIPGVNAGKTLVDFGDAKQVGTET